MAKFSWLRKATVAGVAAVGMVLGAGVAAAQPALPEVPSIPSLLGIHEQGPNKQLVTFGDSFTANAGKGGPRRLEAAPHPMVANCVSDAENWPNTAARELGLSLGDWSCNGTGWPGQLQAYLEGAIAIGDVGSATEKIVVMYGGLDVFQWVDAIGGAVVPANSSTPTAYRQLMQAFVDRARQVAPNAEIIFTSYPEIISGDRYCVVNVNEFSSEIPVPGATDVQDKWRDSLRDAAHFTGAKFFDVYEATRGHGSCNPDPNQRYVIGIYDTAEHTMPNHPTIAGTRAMGHIIAEGIR